jgi:hypothetical protein
MSNKKKRDQEVIENKTSENVGHIFNNTNSISKIGFCPECCVLE